jgi:putative redox protein
VNPPEEAAPEAAIKRVSLRWTGEGLAFEGDGGGAAMLLDSDSEAGPSPMEALLLSLAACMGIDIQLILEKSRVSLRSLDVAVEGRRAPKPPKRFTDIDLVFRLSGPEPGDESKVDRAVRLSRDKYCSVLHSLREDIDIHIRFELT